MLEPRVCSNGSANFWDFKAKITDEMDYVN